MGCLGGPGSGGKLEITANEFRIYFGGDEIVLQLIVVLVGYLISVNILKKIKFYALNVETVWYLN